MQKGKPKIDKFNQICGLLTKLHIEMLKYKEHHDQLKCKASEVMGEQDHPFDCIETVIDKHAEQAKLLDAMISKYGTLLGKVHDLVSAYQSRDIVRLETIINELSKYSNIII